MKISIRHSRRRQRGAIINSPRVARPLLDLKQVARALCLVLLLLVGSVSVYEARGLMQRPVREVAINGDFKYLQQEAVKQVLAPFIQGDYLTLSLHELRDALELLPWVDSAAVKRNWPGGLSITLQEQRPIAWWGSSQLMNSRGHLFSAGDVNVQEQIPFLEGPEGAQAEVMERYVDIGRILGSRGLSVQSLRLSERGSWQTGLKTGVEFSLGRSNIMGKLQRFLAVYDRVLEDRLADIKTVDLRYQNGLAVQWRHNDSEQMLASR